MGGDEATKLNEAMDGMSVAPPEPGDAEAPMTLQRSAGTDGAIRERLESDPLNADAKVDEGSDESMDASDPIAAAQPGASSEPAPSSGFPAKGVTANEMDGSAS